MANTTTVVLGDLIDETFDNLYRYAERPYQITVGASALTDAADTTLTVSDDTVLFPTDRIEAAREVMLVTAKSADATPVFTVARGYGASTAAGGHATGTVLLVNPAWFRHEVERWVKRAITSIFNPYLPQLVTATMNRTAGLQYVEMPSTTTAVHSVRSLSTITGRIVDIAGWQFEDDIPTATVTSGKVLRVSSAIQDDDDLIVVYSTPYAWSGSTEAATIDLPLGSEDLPVLFAAAYGSMRREVSRAELDKVEEWNQDQAIRAGVNLRMVRETWGEFYRRLDDAKQMHRPPKHRPFRKMAKVT